jgi:hypothetical protein
VRERGVRRRGRWGCCKRKNKELGSIIGERAYAFFRIIIICWVAP